LEVTDIVTERRPQRSHAGKEPIMGGPKAQYPPQALNEIKMWAITQQPIQTQMRMGR
jgi:hypothetical protein